VQGFSSIPAHFPLLCRQNWKSHKEYCQKVTAAGVKTFDAILLATNETSPRIVKIPWSWEVYPEEPEGGPSWQKLDLDIWFKQKNSAQRIKYFNRLGSNGPDLGYALCLMYDDNFSSNGSPENRCVEAVTLGKAGHQWCGNLLSLRLEYPLDTSILNSRLDYYKSADIQKDLKPLVRYLEEYGRI